MIRKLFTVCCLLCLSMGALTLSAPEANKKDPFTDVEVPEGFWTATFGTGQYMVALGHICSVAKQSYILDNNLLIREVTVDTNGSALARFYYIEPVVNGANSSGATFVKERAKEVAEDATNRAGSNTGGMNQDTLVIKQYPTTSHAKTIEYRVASAQELDALYGSVIKAWKLGRGRSFSCR